MRVFIQPLRFLGEFLVLVLLEFLVQVYVLHGSALLKRFKLNSNSRLLIISNICSATISATVALGFVL